MRPAPLAMRVKAHRSHACFFGHPQAVFVFGMVTWDVMFEASDSTNDGYLLWLGSLLAQVEWRGRVVISSLV